MKKMKKKRPIIQKCCKLLKFTVQSRRQTVQDFSYCHSILVYFSSWYWYCTTWETRNSYSSWQFVVQHFDPSSSGFIMAFVSPTRKPWTALSYHTIKSISIREYTRITGGMFRLLLNCAKAPSVRPVLLGHPVRLIMCARRWPSSGGEYLRWPPRR